MKDRMIELFKRAMKELDKRSGLRTFGDVADYLIANDVTVQEWISANEPPKENRKRVLIALKWDETDIGWYDKEDKCWRSEYVNCYDVGDVTHWQYLPQPLKGE